MTRRLPASLKNLTSLIGAMLAGISLGSIIFLVAIDLFSKQSHPYMGIVAYMILPGFLNFGLLLVIYGALRARKHARQTGELPTTARLDLSLRSHRKLLIGLMSGGFIFLLASAFGSFQAYEYTETVQFCGQVCHDVMKPEFTAYKTSPHARVDCVQCHIGPGTTWFVRSKLSGSYQVYSVLFHKYAQPIKTPVESLRPAKETCEQCHWPKHFYSEKLQNHTYYLKDEQNTRKDVKMLVKIGGGNPEQGATSGIHWSMFIAHQVSYVSTDRLRSKIPYIEFRDLKGNVTIYRSTEDKLTPQQIAKAEKHTVDCIECHNRPSHVFHHPSPALDQALASGAISTALPDVKNAAIEALEKPYKNDTEAEAGIRTAMLAFYKSKYPAAKQSLVDGAIQETQRIYGRNYFPFMKASWKAYPNHLGHMYSEGCFRCHDGKHVSDRGKVLTNDCNSCHTLLSQTGADGKPEVALKGLEFKHPIDIGDSWKTSKCSECHADATQ